MLQKHVNLINDLSDKTANEKTKKRKYRKELAMITDYGLLMNVLCVLSKENVIYLLAPQRKNYNQNHKWFKCSFLSQAAKNKTLPKCDNLR